MPPATTGPLPRTIGPYVVTEKLGSGGMATVYRATHPQDGREVALKVLAVHLADDEAARIRFEREGRALLQFNHPHILPVYDVGHDGETPYLTMRLMSGRSLDDLLQGRALPVPHLGRLTRQIASALDYAHARGIIHRDIKPENILLDEDNTPYLADFGVAYFAAYENERLTTAGAFVGTAAYASPEQCEGKALDRPSDIYSLAVMVFEMATGRLPFQASSPLAIMKLHLSEPPPNPLAFNAGLPIELYDVLSRAMAKRPERRYPSAMKFSEAVDEALGLHAIPQPASSDDWLFDDIAPVTPDEPSGQWSPPEDPAPDDVLALTPPAEDGDGFPADGGAFTTPEDPFAGVTPARLDSEPFDDSFDVDKAFKAGAVVFAAGDLFDDPGPLPDDDFPAPDAVLGTRSAPPDDGERDAAPDPDAPPGPIRPIGPRPLTRPRRPFPWLRAGLYGTIVISLLAIALAAALAIRALIPPSIDLDATYNADALGVRFDHPADWHVTAASLGILSAAPTGTILLADRDITPGVSMGRATLVIAVQRIDAAGVFRVPPACASLVPQGPQPTFGCMEQHNYSTPVYRRFDTGRFHGVKLPGVLPPARASLPVVIIPTGGAQWIAVIIVYWNHFDDAQTMLDRIAKSVRVQH